MTPQHKIFTTRPALYQRNYKDGENLRVIPAQLDHDTGTTPGVTIFIGRNHIMAVLTAEHAYNLANGIVDALEAHPDRVTTKQEN